MKTFLKYIAVSLSLSIVVIVCALIYTVKNLPNPFVLKKTFNELDQNAKMLNQQTLMENAFAKNAIAKATAGQTVIGQAPLKNEDKIDVNKNIFNQILDEEFSDIRVCENLGSPSSNKLDSNSMGLALMDLRRSDPLVESLRIPLKFVMQSEPVRELLLEVQDLEGLSESEKNQFLDKSNFYYKASLKVFDFYRNKKEYEDMADRAFHLYVINQMVIKKPELLNENHIMDFCKSLQNSIGSKNNSDVGAERAQILKLLAYYKLTPKEVGFNPDIKTKFNFEVKNRTVTFGFEYPGMNL